MGGQDVTQRMRAQIKARVATLKTRYHDYNKVKFPFNIYCIYAMSFKVLRVGLVRGLIVTLRRIRIPGLDF